MVQREKLGEECEEPDDRPPSEDSYWGDVMEPHVAQTFAQRRDGVLLHPRQWADRLPYADVREFADGARRRVMVFNRKAPILRSTPDFVFVPDGDRAVCDLRPQPCIVEVKTTGKIKDWSDGVPLPVQLQTQWHMACSGLRRAFVVVLFFGRTRTLKFFELTIAPELDGLESKGVRFALDWWQRHVVERQPCVPVDLDIPWLNVKFAKATGATVSLPASLATLDTQYVAAHERYSEADRTRTSARKALKSVEAPLRLAMGTASFAEIEGVPALYRLVSGRNGRGRRLTRKAR